MATLTQSPRLVLRPVFDRQRRSITVIPPDTSPREAGAVLGDVSGVPRVQKTSASNDQPG